MERVGKREAAWATALILFALYLSLLENFIPKPFPWMKIGLANIAAIIAVEKFGIKFAIEVTVLRIAIYGIFFSTIFTPGFIISFCAGIASTAVMALLYSSRKFSTVAVSSAAGVVHNVVQMIVVYLLLFRNINIMERGTMMFVFIFLAAGGVNGIITGVAAVKIIGSSKLKRVKQ